MSLATALIAVVLIAGSYYQSRTVTSTALSDFEWFQSLGFRDVKSCPYVRVATGHWIQRGDENTRTEDYIYAFLLATNANTFTVQTLGLAIETFSNTPPSTSGYEKVGFEILNLRNAAQAEVKRLQQPPKQDSFFYRFGEQTTEQTETFVLAWACWRNELSPEARALYDEAKLLPKPFVQKKRRTNRQAVIDAWNTLKVRWQQITSDSESNKPKPTLRQSVEKNIAETVMWRAILAFEDKTVTRSQLLARMNAILTHYPHCENERRIRNTAKVLERMIAEDKAHVPIDSNTLARLPVQDQMRELIFELRDQNGQQIMEPGACDIFMDVGHSTNTPAHQLLRNGYDAVPQLIEALDSDSWTRSVSVSHRFQFFGAVLTIGDCAHTILEQIACKSFDSQPGITNESGWVISAAYRKSAEQWWADWQKKGEKQMLIETVMTGNSDSVRAADRLCERFPDVAVQTLASAIRATSEVWVRDQLLERIASLKSDDVVGTLQTEMTDGPQLSSRVQAAYGLRDLRKTEAIAAMIQEWQTWIDDGGKEQDGTDNLIRFLASSDSVEAVSALRNSLGKCPVNTRLDIVDAIGDREMESGTAATFQAREELLVSALSDTEECEGMSIGRNGFSVSDPRICDMAAWHLSERWPDHYKFDMTKSLKSRDAQRIACLNVWRQAHHLPLETPPPEPKRAKVSRKEAGNVTSIEFAPDGLKPQPKFQADLTRLKNKPLGAEDFVKLLSNFIKSPEPGAVGLQITASRDEDLTGVQMAIKLIPISSPASTQDWQVNETVKAGNESILGSSGGGSYAGTEVWDDLVEAIEKVTSSTPETPFRISVRLKRQ